MRQLLSSPSLAGSQTWVPIITRGRCWHSKDSLFTPFNGWRAVDGATWELIRGLGYSGSSLPSLLGLYSVNILYREDFPQSAYWSRRNFSSILGSQSESWRIEGVRFWKLSRTYLGEKPYSLSVQTQAHHPSGNKISLRESNGPLSSTCPGTTGSFSQDFYFLIKINI